MPMQDEQKPLADAGPVERPVRPRTCATCAHRNGSMQWGKCMLSGSYIEVERKYPARCGKGFSGWVQRETLMARVRRWLYEA
jgi:hypothetical protein